MNKQAFPDHVIEFINSNRLGVLATVSPNNTPEAALLYYGWDEKTQLYCCTFRKSRKFQNIESNNKVAFVIGQEVRAMTLQLEGSAKIVYDHTEKTEIMAKYAKNATQNPDSIYFPPILSLTADSRMEFLNITIEWFRMSTFESHYPNIVEGKPFEWTEHTV